MYVCQNLGFVYTQFYPSVLLHLNPLLCGGLAAIVHEHVLYPLDTSSCPYEVVSVPLISNKKMMMQFTLRNDFLLLLVDYIDGVKINCFEDTIGCLKYDSYTNLLPVVDVITRQIYAGFFLILVVAHDALSCSQSAPQIVFMLYIADDFLMEC